MPKIPLFLNKEQAIRHKMGNVYFHGSFTKRSLKQALFYPISNDIRYEV